ncbi:alpha-amylase [Flavobacteriaceae bacterium Ap0902]|nr:alpha-amylase [Flavobacteriaceae bacterium Ap0902]
MHYRILFFCIFLIFGCKNKSTIENADGNVLEDSLKLAINNEEDMTPKNEHVSWSKNATIYEINVRQFSEEGTFEAVTNDLQRIKDLGIDIIWLMPIHPIGELNRKGTLGSYYAVKDYKAVNPEFGNLEDFKLLVDTAHDLGLKVIIDWVANHSSPDNVWIKDHLDYYTKDSLGNAPIPTIGTDWMDVADLNYDNPDMRAAMQDAMQYWIKETNIDGFRCDVAEYVPLDFWVDTRAKLDSIKPVFMLAEGAKPELYEAFDMTYGWPFKDLIIEIADGEKTFNAIPVYLEKLSNEHDEGDITMFFTTNHDENSWNYLERDKFSTNLQNYQALTFFMGGMPLIYNGQESGLNKQLKFFEKDPIDWGDYEYTSFYQNLNKILDKHEVLWNDSRATYEVLSADDLVFNFIISKDDKHLAVLQNYSNYPMYISKISLTGLNLEKNLLESVEHTVSDRGVEIPPHSTVVLGQ